ncbi:hypothetical protein CC2G_000387 [Coprinopsis cinerea AmutBmut pab1-1]|nr:hypothetical protein CC2G_000387 [Coprinopsis cinerea AmutBmut pab1-1]
MPIAINSQHRTDYSSELAYFDTGVTTAVMPSPSSSLSDKEGEGMEAVKRMNGNAKPPPSSFSQPNGDDGWTTSTQARLSFQLGTTLNVPEDYGRKVNPPPQTSQPRLTLDLGDSNANSHFDPDRANPPLSQQQPLTADSNGSHSVYATPLTSVEPQPSPWARPSPTPPPPHQSHPSLSARTPSPLYTLDGAARVPSEGSQDRGDIGGTRFTPGNHSLSSNPLANGDKHQQSQGHTSGSTPAGVEGAARTEEEMMILARASYLHQNNQNQNLHHSQYMNGLPSTPRKQGTYQPPHQRRSPSPYSNGSQQSHHSQHHQQSPHQHPHQGYQHQGGVSAASAPPSAFNTPQHSRMSSRSSPVSSRSGTPVRPGANGYVAPSPVQSRSPSRNANPGHNAPAIDSRSPSRSQTPSSTLNPNMLSSPPSRPPSRVSLRQHAPSGQSSYHSQQQQKTASPAPSPIGISTSQSTSNHSREESGSTTSQTHSLDISQQSHQYSVSLAPSNQSHSNAYQHSNTSHQYPPSQYSSTSTGASQSQYQPSLSNGYYQSQAEYGGSTASGFEPRPSLLRDGSIGSRNGDKELPRTPSLLGIGANGRAGAGGSPPSSDQAQPRHSVGNRALQLHLLAVSGGATGGDRSVGGDGVGLGIRGSVTSGSGAGPDASPPPPPPPPSSMKPVSSPPRASSASASAAQTSTPRTSSSVHRHGHMSSPPGHSIRAKPSTVSLNPSLRPSLVPSAGEEPDAFHVRSTYAQLEVYGVKGDGFDEGVERTRAARTRVGSSVATPSPNASTSLSHSPDTSATSPDSNGHQPPHRTKSQVLADEAIADENEKKRELEPEEIRVLQSVDRYGFMSVTSHERLILLPSVPLLKPLSSGAGAPSSPPSNSTSPPPLKTLQSIPPPQTNPKENDRIEKWNRMLVPHQRDEGGNVQAWRVRPSKTSKLRRRVYKGVPDRWRAAVWEVLMCAYVAGHGGDVEGGGYDGNGNPNRPWQEVDTETIVRLTASPDAASAGVRQVERSAREYREGIERPSTYDVQIDLDVPRTVSGNILFKTRYGAGQRSLFHVLHAFSLTCPVCGYVQGMGPLAATLLSYLPPSLSYTCLLRLHTSYNMHTIFSPGFPGLLEAIYVQEQLTKTYMPAVYESFKRNTIGGTSYATKWYITMFANSVPFQMQLRLWDVFWLEGMDVFVAVAVGVLWVYKDQITSPHANFETILSLLSSFFVPEDEDVFMGWIEKMLCDRKIRGSMNQWRKEWKVLVESGKEVEALL